MLEAVLDAALDGEALAAELAVDVVADCGAVAFFCPDVIAPPVFATFDDGLLPAAATEAGFVAGLGVEDTLAF